MMARVWLSMGYSRDPASHHLGRPTCTASDQDTGALGLFAWVAGEKTTIAEQEPEGSRQEVFNNIGADTDSTVFWFVVKTGE